MRKLPLALIVLLAGTASAQPGADDAPYPPPPSPVQAPPPQPQPDPQPQPYQPQPYAQPPYGQPGYGQPLAIQLTADEHELLQKGEISDGAHIGGALGSLLFGFGVGQAVQGRYGETGWIFTVGELASITALVIGVSQSIDDCFGTDQRCNDNRGEGLLIAGLVGLVGFRVWEVFDAFAGPPKHNARVRQLRMRLGMPMPMYTHRVIPYVKSSHEGGGTAGLVFRF